jgi:Domain of unknown function (DUF4112)
MANLGEGAWAREYCLLLIGDCLLKLVIGYWSYWASELLGYGALSLQPAVTLAWLRRWADLLDSRFRVPGTDIRFGIDPLLSLIPGLGDLASPVFTVVLIVQGLQQRVPKVVMVRMVINALLDALIGAVPVLGNVGDVFWRANTLNLALLERHARPGRPPSRADYAFVFGLAAVFGVLVLAPFVMAIWLAGVFWRWVVFQ